MPMISIKGLQKWILTNLQAKPQKVGVAALQGEQGPARDSLIYSSSIMLTHMGIEKNLQTSAQRIREIIDSGKAFTHFQKNQLH